MDGHQVPLWMDHRGDGCERHGDRHRWEKVGTSRGGGESDAMGIRRCC